VPAARTGVVLSWFGVAALAFDDSHGGQGCACVGNQLEARLLLLFGSSAASRSRRMFTTGRSWPMLVPRSTPVP
jgi:hypothetical protein